jgi:hypothetical protein
MLMETRIVKKHDLSLQAWETTPYKILAPSSLIKK